MDRLRQKAQAIHQILLDTYGPPERKHLDPVSELVCTILSQNTNDLNRDVAYQALRARFPTWEQVRDAPVEEVIEAIRPAGLANQKGPRIQAALRKITEERGRLDLDFLADMPVEEAKAWLTRMNGVGPKTAAIILLFSLNRPAFPVDTHIHRVTRRLGLIGPKVTAEQAHGILEGLIAPEHYYAFHLNLIQHGRLICKAGKPRCELCAIREYCDYYQRLTRSQPPPSPLMEEGQGDSASL
jgi:endonuclease-3